ncbi:conserved Plasmodium protein, unknown function [Plasmodium gallinaceum]|uniref:Uncharacterized protein n=1 Tax=Plasmodium gallinaceum TaxID=5849 RepID=A0A1J1GTP3_PLAGA|nr:conserved Plasmodium protein, unknown function [Plasmodium gallinaceum]CRG95611.1 conserved Plasmodium protein, unknown function [Plasmodium gallinaceum]
MQNFSYNDLIANIYHVNLYNQRSVIHTEKITKLYNLKNYNSLNKIYLISCGNNFIFKNNKSFNSINNIQNENNIKEDDSDNEDDDKLVLNADSDDNEGNESIEEKKINSDKNIYDNKSTSTNLNYNLEAKNIPTQYKKRSKYDSDKIIIYEDITELPRDICNLLLTDDEIEQINTGVPDCDFGNYVNNITHNKKK